MPKDPEQVWVRVVRTDTGEVVKELGPMSESRADRVERGLLINMDRDKYHTDQVTRDER